MSDNRPTWETTWFTEAETMARRGTCLRRNSGAKIVSPDNDLISSGYTGAPRGTPNCCDIGKCYRNEMNIPSGARYELCRSVHAEMNAIAQAGRERILNASRDGKKCDMYLVTLDKKTGERIDAYSCLLCKRVIINSGIGRVIAYTRSGTKIYLVSDWIEEAKKDPFAELNLGR